MCAGDAVRGKQEEAEEEEAVESPKSLNSWPLTVIGVVSAQALPDGPTLSGGEER